ncbi:MarR family winged helix-turn-helix transcriptional regulator [Kribbella sp. NPDC049174]|uniref:MarR family winged helix-turn-helix transcriptional regulator n=1 Tax=Kribbella sp. NPDC049174 TaxID=3364112 RepID=UPI0037178392
MSTRIEGRLIPGHEEQGMAQRRSPTAEQLRIWRAYIETADQLRSALAARLQAESGLSPGDYAVLLALSEADGRRMRSSELADQIGWERSRLSHHLGRMERRELIHREPCATDSRGAEIVLTSTGADAFRRSSIHHLHAVRELFVDALTPDQLDAVQDFTAALRTHRTERPIR